MADPNPSVNDQITDAVTQNNVKVVAESPAMAMSSLYTATGQALGNAAHWATTATQNATIVSQAATVMGVTTLYGIDTASTAEGIAAILEAA